MAQKQQSIVLDIDANTKTLIDEKLIEGYFIHSVTNLNPTIDKLLILFNKNLEPPPLP